MKDFREQLIVRDIREIKDPRKFSAIRYYLFVHGFFYSQSRIAVGDQNKVYSDKVKNGLMSNRYSALLGLQTSSTILHTINIETCILTILYREDTSNY